MRTLLKASVVCGVWLVAGGWYCCCCCCCCLLGALLRAALRTWLRGHARARLRKTKTMTTRSSELEMRSAKNKFRRVAEIVGCHNLHIRDETFSLPFLRFEAIELVKRLDESK